MSDIENSDPLLTVKGLADREGVTQDTIRKFIKRENCPHYRVQGIRIRWSEYQHWLSTKSKESIDVPTALDQLRQQLAVAAEVAPLLREKGILSIEAVGLKLSLAQAAPDTPRVDSNNNQDLDKSSNPLQDSLLYGRTDGRVPGFAKLQQKPGDE